MKTDTPQTIYLKDYTPPAFLVDTVDLDFVIEAGGTTVTATLALRRNPAIAAQPLILDGEELETLSVAVDGEKVPFPATPNTLTIADVPDAFTLQTVARIDPDANTSLSGFYRSRDGYFTQCEAQGFRRITWLLDRPDVMSSYTVRCTPAISWSANRQGPALRHPARPDRRHADTRVRTYRGCCGRRLDSGVFGAGMRRVWRRR